MNSIFITLGLYSLLFHAVLAKPSGAPNDACVSMTPGHDTSAQTVLSSPYQVTVDESYYEAGKAVNVTIKSSGNDIFNGILVQAREANKNTTIGTFSDDLPSDVKHLACNNQKDSVTHSKKLGLTNITLKWIPPANISGLGNISFFATVVKDKETFWVKLESPKLPPMVVMNVITTTVHAIMVNSYQMTMMVDSTKALNMPERSMKMSYMATLMKRNVTKSMNATTITVAMVNTYQMTMVDSSKSMDMPERSIKMSYMVTQVKMNVTKPMNAITTTIAMVNTYQMTMNVDPSKSMNTPERRTKMSYMVTQVKMNVTKPMNAITTTIAMVNTYQMTMNVDPSKSMDTPERSMKMSYMATPINLTKSMPMPEPSSSVYKKNTTCPPKCNANASPLNLPLLASSILLLLLKVK